MMEMVARFYTYKEFCSLLGLDLFQSNYFSLIFQIDVTMERFSDQFFLCLILPALWYELHP